MTMLKRLFSLFDNPINEVDYQGESHNEYGNDGADAQCGLSGFFFYFAAVIQQPGFEGNQSVGFFYGQNILPEIIVVCFFIFQNAVYVHQASVFGVADDFMFKVFLVFDVMVAFYQRNGVVNQPLRQMRKLSRSEFFLDIGIEVENAADLGGRFA